MDGFYLLAHPPIIVPEIGNGEERNIEATTNSFDIIAKEIKAKAPNTIILITPHGPMFNDAIAITYEDSLKGDFGRFGAPQVSMEIAVNKKLSQEIYKLATKDNIPVVMSTKELLNQYNVHITLDHGAMVPLYFINRFYKDYSLVHITYAPLGDFELYKFGMSIKNAVDKLKEKAIIIASGDLSHRLKEDGPYGYNPLGEKFDNEFLQHLEKANLTEVFTMSRECIENAGECGRRSVLIMLGTMDEIDFKGYLLSYEKTFGVGYGIMKFEATNKCKTKLNTIIDSINNKNKNQANPYVRLARESLTTYLENKKIMDKLPPYISEEMKKLKRGVFVSLKKNGKLRGCIGTIFPVTSCVAQEIIRNSVEAGIYDPRFLPVEISELNDIEFSVDVLTEAESATKDELNPKEYGVIVRSNGKTGLLLPDLEGVDTVEEQLSIALRKAGINPLENYSIERFKVIRHREE